MCGRHFENGLGDAMNKQIFAVNILVSYSLLTHAQVIVDSLRRNCWL